MDLFLKAMKGENKKSRPPIWLMRQAGRYMPEYRTLREKYSFMGLCKHPELIAEVTELPIKRFGFDAAIVFSDILLITETLGCELHFEEGRGPVITPIESVDSLVHHPVVPSMQFVMDGIRLLKERLQVPLIGFAGAPFTVASYLIEGGVSRDLKKTKRWMIENPESFHQLLQVIKRATIEYIQGQIEAGVDCIQLFDSWAHVLSWNHFEEFSFRYLQDIVSEFKKIPIIVFCRGSSFFYEKLAQLEPQVAISLDWHCDMAHIRKKLPKTTLQGNLDPDILLAASREQVVQEVDLLLEKMKDDPAFICNLGHGILPTTPEENVYALIETVHKNKI